MSMLTSGMSIQLFLRACWGYGRWRRHLCWLCHEEGEMRKPGGNIPYSSQPTGLPVCVSDYPSVQSIHVYHHGGREKNWLHDWHRPRTLPSKTANMQSP